MAKIRGNICLADIFFSISCPVNHLMTTQIHLVASYQGVHPLDWEPLVLATNLNTAIY